MVSPQDFALRCNRRCSFSVKRKLNHNLSAPFSVRGAHYNRVLGGERVPVAHKLRTDRAGRRDTPNQWRMCIRLCIQACIHLRCWLVFEPGSPRYQRLAGPSGLVSPSRGAFPGSGCCFFSVASMYFRMAAGTVLRYNCSTDSTMQHSKSSLFSSKKCVSAWDFSSGKGRARFKIFSRFAIVFTSSFLKMA